MTQLADRRQARSTLLPPPSPRRHSSVNERTNPKAEQRTLRPFSTIDAVKENEQKKTAGFIFHRRLLSSLEQQKAERKLFRWGFEGFGSYKTNGQEKTKTKIQ